MVLNSQSDQPNQRYAINKGVAFSQGKGDLPIITVTTHTAKATISLLGGQVLSYHPTSTKHDLLFLSHNAYFEQGKAIKGGIPICWPWFAAHPEDDTLPFHGFVRNQLWQVESTEQRENGDVIITLIFKDSEQTRKLWPYAFELKQVINIGDKLGIKLFTTNTGKQNFDITQALHSYFSVGDISQVNVTGLENKPYLDKVEQFKKKIQPGQPISIEQEVDRIYQKVDKPLSITDKSWNRQIHITHSGSATTVVWNPWIAISRNSKDLEDNDYQRFICVETANAADNVITVKPNETYTLGVEYCINEI